MEKANFANEAINKLKTNKMVVVSGERGSGKTYESLIVLMNCAMSTPNLNCYIVTKSLCQARNILRNLFHDGSDFTGNCLKLYNGSKIYCGNPGGKKIDFLYADEAATIPDLDKIIANYLPNKILMVSSQKKDSFFNKTIEKLSFSGSVLAA